MNKEHCNFPNCGRARVYKDFCQGHYRQHKADKPLTELHSYGRKHCGFEGCGEPHFCRGYCVGHYMQAKRGKPMRPLKYSFRAKRRRKTQAA